MNVTLLVGSQKQLADGLPWLQRFAEVLKATPNAIVLGTDHRALARKVELEMQRQGSDATPVGLVTAEANAVVAQLSTSKCRLLVMVDDVDDDRLQAAIFERCCIETVWLNVKSTPPESEDHLFSLDDDQHATACSVARRLLGIAPSLQLDHGWLLNAPEMSDGGAEHALRLERKRCDEGDLICVPFASAPSREPYYELSRALLNQSSKASVALVSSKQGWERSLLAQLRYLASHVAEPMDRDARLELAQSLSEGSQPNWEFLGLISAAAMLSAFGLLQNSAAVIIGAMLIAPLMTPIMGAGLALAQGNRPLFQTSCLTIGLGFAGGFASSFLFGLLVRLVQTPVVTPEMWSRCNPSPLDFCVGLVGGMAASYARTRSHLSSALAGAAIAAALVPPIATAGLQAAFGIWHETDQGWPVFGPLLLVSVNVLTIMIGTSLVLYARGLHVVSTSPRQAEAKSNSSKWATRVFVMLLTVVLMVLVWMLHLERLFL
ncbi:DUF389 domain-containing protein [Allorhodopirellula solitaria]|uniref:Integral membrane protein n=1 Tax=Allorhodopirellula solitaria TaxID=2527987 RepID=A0A5C5YHK7_9BACT|nr:DUF389 domain-containing protein [Allorhodopirellula solitaria]TWT74265.1 hypothetical protein CA85_11520 [Allorhodopirellula solitaria]